jgi:glycerol uptake facilitator-like aquaporin
MGREPTSAFLMFANPAVTIALSLSNTVCWHGAYHPPAFIAAQCAGTLAHGRQALSRLVQACVGAFSTPRIHPEYLA